MRKRGFVLSVLYVYLLLTGCLADRAASPTGNAPVGPKDATADMPSCAGLPKVIDASPVAYVTRIGGSINDTAIQGTCLFVAWVNELLVINISDPVEPVVVGLRRFDNDVVGVVVNGREAVVAVKDVCKPTCISYHRVDMIDPSKPLSREATKEFYESSLQLDQTRLNDLEPEIQARVRESLGLEWSADDIATFGDYAYVLDVHQGLYVLDISERAAPVVVGLLAHKNLPQSIEIVDDHIYLISEKDAIDVFELRDPSAPNYVATMPIGGEQILIAGQWVYTSQEETLAIWDISDVYDPTMIGTYAATGPIRDIAFEQNCVFFIYTYEETGEPALNEIQVLDVSNPADIRLVGNVPDMSIGGYGYNLWVQNQHLYYVSLGGPSNFLCILNVSEPVQPELLHCKDGIRIWGEQWFAADSSHYYYIRHVGAWSGLHDMASLHVVDRESLDELELHNNYLGHFVDRGGIAVIDGYIYVAGKLGGLIVFRNNQVADD